MLRLRVFAPLPGGKREGRVGEADTDIGTP
jgi:hypothetical protein